MIAWEFSEGVGNYTTGTFEVKPYVGHWASPTPEGASVTLVCVPNEAGPSGYISITSEDLIVFRLWDDQFTTRTPLLCEFEIESDGEWSLEVGIEVQR